MIIGIDIGGTHTDGVLVQGKAIVKSCKLPTTFPLEKGVAAVLKELVSDPTVIQQVIVGTTHATNAILEAKSLSPVGVLRIAGQVPSIEPCLDWPVSLVETVFAGVETIGGGYHFDRRELTPFSLQEVKEAIELPVLTLCAGPTNSFVGASHLTGLRDAIVVDIGGTSTDIGVVREGFARRSLNQSEVGGVRLSFPMPDVLSLSIGGGSLVALGPNPQIGPRSCASELLKRGRSFGGADLTLTDLALHLGHLQIPGAAKIELEEGEAKRVFGCVLEKIHRAIRRAEAGRADLPIIVVGGGAALMPQNLDSRYFIPPHAGAANAYGAALAEISGQIDTVVSLEKGRQEKLEELRSLAIDRAVRAGAARETVRIAQMEVIPYSYMPSGMARVTLVAAGGR